MDAPLQLTHPTAAALRETKAEEKKKEREESPQILPDITPSGVGVTSQSSSSSSSSSSS